MSPAATSTTVERNPALASNMVAALLVVAEADAEAAVPEADAAAALVPVSTTVSHGSEAAKP